MLDGESIQQVLDPKGIAGATTDHLDRVLGPTVRLQVDVLKALLSIAAAAMGLALAFVGPLGAHLDGALARLFFLGTVVVLALGAIAAILSLGQLVRLTEFRVGLFSVSAKAGAALPRTAADLEQLKSEVAAEAERERQAALRSLTWADRCFWAALIGFAAAFILVVFLVMAVYGP